MKLKNCHKGFTLIEVTLVIALITLVFAIAFTSFDLLTRGFTEKSIEETFFNALRRSRYLAQTSKTTVHLGYNRDDRAFTITKDTEDNPTTTIEIQTSDNTPITVTFTPIIAEEGLGDNYAFRLSNNSREYLSVNELGVSEPMFVKINTFDEKIELKLDPFSSTILPQPKNG